MPGLVTAPPNIILQLGEGLPVVLGVVPGIPHDVLVDIEQAVPVPPFGKLLHPLAPDGVDVSVGHCAGERVAFRAVLGIVDINKMVFSKAAVLPL